MKFSEIIYLKAENELKNLNRESETLETVISEERKRYLNES